MLFHGMLAQLSFILSQIMRLTDRQTDRQMDRQTERILIARPRLHSMQRGKKLVPIHKVVMNNA